jgi:hypothetical protein
MSQNGFSVVIAGIELELFRKEVKHLNLRIYPPDGVVHVTAPKRMSASVITRFVEAKTSWIIGHQNRMSLLPVQEELTYKTGEKHRFLGNMYSIEFEGTPGKSTAQFLPNRTLHIETRHCSNSDSIARLLRNVYRNELQSILDLLIPKWEARLGVRSKRIRIRLMRRKWGACRPFSGDIVFNLDLIKHPQKAIEYVVLHELAHLIEPSHNERFQRILSDHMPNWRVVEGMLNERVSRDISS